MSYEPDATDKRIVQFLLEDSKTTIKEIATRLNMSNTPIFDRIKKMEKEGVIEGYSTRVNKKKLGINIIAFCSITLEKHHKDFISQFVVDVKGLPEVKECYHIAGMYDYLLKICVQDMDSYQHFISNKLSSLSNMSRVQSSFVMTEIKNEDVLLL